MSKKSNKYRCGVCGFETNTIESLSKHYRKQHPNDAYKMYDDVGTVGDAFADKYIETLKNNLKASRDNSEVHELKKETKELREILQEVISDNNKSGNALLAIKYILDSLGGVALHDINK